MATETQATPTFQPTILHVKTDYRPNSAGDHWDFRLNRPEGEDPPVTDLFIKQLGVYAERARELSTYQWYNNVRYIAAHRDNEWVVARAVAYKTNYYFIHLFDIDERAVDKIAFPVDPRMTRQDIEGATKIYENEDGTAWLFAHASAGNHHDHEINLISGDRRTHCNRCSDSTTST